MASRTIWTIKVCGHVILRQALEHDVIDDEPVTPRRLCHARVERPVILRQAADERQDAIPYLLLTCLGSRGISDCCHGLRTITQLALRDGIQLDQERRARL